MPTVASGQTLSVTSGQTSTGIIVDSGGTLDVFSGGKVSGAVDSGFVNISGGNGHQHHSFQRRRSRCFWRRQRGEHHGHRPRRRPVRQ